MTVIDKDAYGKALFLAAIENESTDTVYEHINSAVTAISVSPEYTKLLDTPALYGEQKHELIDAAFGALDPLVLNLIKMLSDKSAFFEIEKIAAVYGKLYDEHRNVERVEAITAVPLTQAQTEALTEKLGKMIGKQIILTNTVTPEILGGIKLSYSGVQLDGSLRRRLDDIEKILKNTVI